MKKFKYLLVTAFALTAFSSCSEDDLNYSPDTSIEVEYLKNPIDSEKRMDYVLKGMYATMRHEEAFGSYLLNIGNLVSDDVFVSTSNSGYYVTTSRMNWTPSNAEQNFTYNRLYDVIQVANFVINAKIEETALVKKYKSQAYIARGMAFFYLAQSYSPMPTSGVNQEYGIAIYTGEFDPFAKYGRSTVAQTYEQIVSDLKNGIIAENETGDDKTFFTATAGRLLLSKVYLTLGNYTEAKQYAEETIAKAAGSKLITKDKLATYFYSASSADSDNQSETVWEVAMSEKSNVGVNRSMGGLYDPISARRAHALRADFVDTYGPTDVRKTMYVKDSRPADAPNQGYFIKKYKQTVDGKPNIANIKVLRLTDALFVKWEAMAKLGDSSALTELNVFATERGGTTYSGDVLEAVLTEKHKEFAGEGQRFFDLKRNNLPIVNKTNCSSNCDVPAGDKIFVFPIPTSSTNINDLIKQYPGWNN